MSPIAKLLRSTTFRVSLVYLLVFAVCTVVLVGYSSWTTKRIIEDRTLETIAAEVRGLAERYAQGGIQELVGSVDARARTSTQTLYLITAFNGAGIAGNISQVPLDVMREEGVHTVPYVPRQGAGGRSRVATVRVFPLASGFSLLVGRDISDQRELEALLWQTGLAAAAIVSLLGLGGGIYIGQRVLSRLDEVAETGTAIMAGDLSERIPLTGTGDEFDRLAVRLNLMLERIETLLRGMQDVTENVAHDLRTPLTRIKARAEDALRNPDHDHAEVVGAIIEDADALISMFDAMLSIARLQSGADVSKEAVDLGAVIDDTIELYEPVADDANLDLRIGSQPGAPALVHGNRGLLSQMLANLIDNAIKYGRPVDEIRGAVTIDLVADKQSWKLRISDQGIGIPEEDHRRVLDRFVRLEQSRSEPGSGLGLSLVKAVAELHGGQLALSDADPGLCVEITLPQDKTRPKA